MSADIIWFDAAIASDDLPLGLTFGFQGGVISPDTLNDTDAFGARVGLNVGGFNLGLAYTDVDDGTVAARNLGTNNRSPLYTQMVANQNAISLDSKTIVASVGFDAGSIGNFGIAYGLSDVGNGNGTVNTAGNDVDYEEIDLTYSVKTGGIEYFAAAVFREVDNGGTIALTTSGATATDDDTLLRFWARYNF